MLHTSTCVKNQNATSETIFKGPSVEVFKNRIEGYLVTVSLLAQHFRCYVVGSPTQGLLTFSSVVNLAVNIVT